MSVSLGNSRAGKRLPRLVKFAISALLIGTILAFVDIEAMLVAVQRFSPIYLLPAIAIVAVDRWLVVYKWQILLRAKRIDLPFWRLFHVYTIALLSGYLLPSTVGGDVYRVFALSRDGVNASLLTASVIVERLLGFLSMLAIVAVAIAFGALLATGQAMPLKAVGTGIGILAVASVAVIVGIRSSYVGAHASRLSSNSHAPKFVRKLVEVFLVCRDYDTHGGVLGKVFVLTIIRQFLPISVVVILASALSIGASLTELLAIVPLIILGNRLPIAINGIGVQEGLYVVLFAIVGVSAADALVLSLTFRLLVLFTLLPFAFGVNEKRES